MQKTIITVVLIGLFSISATAQKVEVDQAFVDGAVKALKEVRLLRQALKDKKDELAKKDKVIAIQKNIIKFKNDLLKQRQERVDYLLSIKCQVTEFKFKPFGWTIFKTKKQRCFE